MKTHSEGTELFKKIYMKGMAMIQVAYPQQ
jgi:hypothetical protein